MTGYNYPVENRLSMNGQRLGKRQCSILGIEKTDHVRLSVKSIRRKKRKPTLAVAAKVGFQLQKTPDEGVRCGPCGVRTRDLRLERAAS